MQPPPFYLTIGSDGDLTPPAQGLQKGPLGLDRYLRFWVVQEMDEAPRGVIPPPRFETQGPLADGGQDLFG